MFTPSILPLMETRQKASSVCLLITGSGKQDMRIKTWLLGNMHLIGGVSSTDGYFYLPLRYGQVSSPSFFFLLDSMWTTLK